MKNSSSIATLGIIALSLVACSSPSSSSVAASPSAAARQVERGAAVYGAHCADCHGAAGEGTRRGPAVVGTGALPLEPRAWQERSTNFRTALDIAVFATQNMPPDASIRANVPESDYWAVLAFALSANGVQLDEPVNADNAGSIVLHP